jgi:hypothetical protein
MDNGSIKTGSLSTIRYLLSTVHCFVARATLGGGEVIEVVETVEENYGCWA